MTVPKSTERNRWPSSPHKGVENALCFSRSREIRMAGVVLALLLCFVGSSLGDDAYSAVYPPAYPPIYPPRCPPVPNPPYGYVKIVNYKCNYYCKDGYKLVGSSYRTCRSGSWYPDAPKCVPGIHIRKQSFSRRVVDRMSW